MTKVARQTPTSDSLRTTIPAIVAKDIDIQEGDYLHWDVDGGRIIVTIWDDRTHPVQDGEDDGTDFKDAAEILMIEGLAARELPSGGRKPIASCTCSDPPNGDSLTGVLEKSRLDIMRRYGDNPLIHVEFHRLFIEEIEGAPEREYRGAATSALARLDAMLGRPSAGTGGAAS
ncbi:MAG: AbrB/MazE/SpoVT family DNA-binding domain-containing protein [Alphaproteobacteria bacterium]|nr:AbrB/MazE/SpoVT family DNA-binding domain-containing protein [Alphaproteobacteria bacterium]